MDKHKLILDNIEIPKILALKLAAGSPGTVDELVAEGNLALCEAAEKYSQGGVAASFATYASKCVWNAQIRHKRFLGSVIDVPIYADLPVGVSLDDDFEDYD